MKLKKTQSGFTLVELIVAAAILTIILASVVGAMYTFYRNYQANEKMLEDEYIARSALVYITREIHSDIYTADVPEDGGSRLILTALDNEDKKVEFYLDGDNNLQRLAPDGHEVSFISKELVLEEFKPVIIKKDGQARRVELYIRCRDGKNGERGLELRTSVALLRTQRGSDEG